MSICVIKVYKRIIKSQSHISTLTNEKWEEIKYFNQKFLMMDPSSNLSSLASLDSLEGSISESDKPLMNYSHMNMSGHHNDIYKLNSEWIINN